MTMRTTIEATRRPSPLITLTTKATTAPRPHDRGDRSTRPRRGERHPGASQGHDDEEQLANDTQRLVGDPYHRGDDDAEDQDDGGHRREPL